MAGIFEKPNKALGVLKKALQVLGFYKKLAISYQICYIKQNGYTAKRIDAKAYALVDYQCKVTYLGFAVKHDNELVHFHTPYVTTEGALSQSHALVVSFPIEDVLMAMHKMSDDCLIYLVAETNNGDRVTKHCGSKRSFIQAIGS